jgi:hypothetical protein
MGLMEILRNIPQRLRRKAEARIDPDAPPRDPNEMVGSCKYCTDPVIYAENIGVDDADAVAHATCDSNYRRLKLSDVAVTDAFRRTVMMLCEVQGMDGPLRRLVDALPDRTESHDLVHFIISAERELKLNTELRNESTRKALLLNLRELRKSFFTVV